MWRDFLTNCQGVNEKVLGLLYFMYYLLPMGLYGGDIYHPAQPVVISFESSYDVT